VLCTFLASSFNCVWVKSVKIKLLCGWGVLFSNQDNWDNILNSEKNPSVIMYTSDISTILLSIVKIHSQITIISYSICVQLLASHLILIVADSQKVGSAIHHAILFQFTNWCWNNSIRSHAVHIWLHPLFIC
jgi:hypothetical protein